MPTKRQLNILRESELEFFGGQDPMTYKSPDHNSHQEFTGETIGHIEIDPKTRAPRIVVHKKTNTEEDSQTNP